MRASHLHSFDGTEIYYTVSGQGPIDFVLCDGIGCDGFIWRYLRDELATRGRIIHAHMRGHGRSHKPRDPRHVEIRHLADDLNLVLTAERQNPTVVLGHSMGVQVALELWHRHPHHVGALILMCGSYGNPVATFHDDPTLERILPLIKQAAHLGGDRLHRIWKRLIGLPIAFHVAQATEIHPDLTRREDFEPYLKHLADMNPGLFFRMLGCAGDHSAEAYLSEIDVPVLVIAGEHDRFTPARLSEKMADGIPNAQLLLVEDGTHTAPIEHPVLVNLSVTDFLDKLDWTPPHLDT
ncbi:MAG: alpha/beta hydrolase [Myxococcota bacterium]|nr:alpha/beta hydrolase [Myxococcota bacterium]